MNIRRSRRTNADLEKRLRDERPVPEDGLVRSIMASMSTRPVAARRRAVRLSLAGALTVAACAAFAAAGGVSYAASQATHAVTAVKTVTLKATGAAKPSAKPKPKPINPSADTSGKSQYTAEPPTIKSISPKSGCTNSAVKIKGKNLQSITSVKFGGVSAAFTVKNNDQIGAIAPGPGAVSVSGGNGSAVGPTFTLGPPKVKSVYPKEGPVGTNVTIGGSCFTGATFVTFNGVSASFSVNSDTSISATVPGGATTGPVSVATPLGSDSGKKFTVTP